MTYSRRSLRHIAYYALLLVLLLVVGSSSASAQPSVPPPIVGAGTPMEDPNPKTPFDTREDYFKRFPFARNAFDHDNKEVHEWSTRVVEGPPDPGFFDTITDVISNVGSSISNFLGFGGSNGGASSSNANQSPETRSQHSMPLEGASGPVHVTAYPFFIKFCNDNPYQGVCYWQAGEAFDRPRTDRDLELFENVLTTFGYPVSDTQFQLIQRENFQRLLELMYDPERYVWMATNTSQMQAASAANSMAGVSEQAFAQMVEFILDGHNGNDGLLNVANENSATAMNLNALYRPVSAAYDVVMRSYKEIYVPMAILFLLPGAVITQVKATVSKGFDLGDGNPFEGIIRSMVAIFLIPGTQVIVSYSIDVGNSMATTAEDWVDRGLIIDWQHELTYNVNPQEDHKNVIEPPEVDDNQELRQVVFEGQNGEGGDDSIVTGNPGNAIPGGGGGGVVSTVINFFSTVLSWLAGTFAPGVFGSGGEGLGANVPEADTTQEEQLALSQIMQFLFNGATFLGALTIIILTATQVVLICYLFLLGPLSAAFFAWPQLGQNLFRNVLASWLQAVITVSLWRFYWVLGLLIMTQRLLYINNPAGVHLGTGDLQWEVVIFVCILALMIYTSMAPFNYDPEAAMKFVDDFKDASIDTGKALAAGGGEPGGGAGGAGGQGGESGQPSSGGGSSDNRTESSGGSSDSSVDSDINPSDNATERIADSGGGGEESTGSESADSESRTESIANDSPQDSNAPPMESGGGGSGGGGEGSTETSAPPSAQTDAMMAGGAASLAAGSGGTSSESSEAGDAVASSGYESQKMPEDSAPVDRSPGDGSAQTGNYNQDADASQAQAGIASQTQSGGGSDSSDSGGSPSSPGEMNMTIGQEGDDSGGSSESPQPPNMGNIQPPPMSDSSDDD